VRFNLLTFAKPFIAQNLVRQFNRDSSWLDECFAKADRNAIQFSHIAQRVTRIAERKPSQTALAASR